MRPDDHFMVLTETDASPMHVGALMFLAVPEAERATFHTAIARQLEERLAHTPLLAQLVEAPDGYDSDVWVDRAGCDLAAHVEAVPADDEWDDRRLRTCVAQLSMRRLDLTRPPFHAYVFDRLTGGRCALYLKMHHAVADGIGFQTILHLLSDAMPPAAPRRTDGTLPAPDEWRAASDAEFARLAPLAAEHSARRKRALAELKIREANPNTRRATTPRLALSGPTSAQRSYATCSIPLALVKEVGRQLGATINDIFLALCATAVRRFLVAIDDLPDTPIVVNSARSYRTPAHGDFGNRIVAMHPHLATLLADPVERLRAIQASMALERGRTHLDEALLDQPEWPYGGRDRRAKFAARMATGSGVLPGNLTVSNVPGRAEALSYAGYPQVANYPVPIIGSSRFLNITSRRNADRLDIGVMADPTKVPDVERIAEQFVDALAEYEVVAGPFTG
jgi:WS/DGAT/MGAT family acyltransferase